MRYKPTIVKNVLTDVDADVGYKNAKIVVKAEIGNHLRRKPKKIVSDEISKICFLLKRVLLKRLLLKRLLLYVFYKCSR